MSVYWGSVQAIPTSRRRHADTSKGKALSNAMRSSKSILAGVAAGALALGALTIASAPAASAKPSIKPKATATAAVSAVRATGTTSPLSLPAAKMAWRGTGNLTGGTITLTTAPTGGAIMTTYTDAAGTTVDDTVTLLQNGESFGPAVVFSADDTGVRFKVDTAGLYAGYIANGSDTVSFSFNTAGTPVAMTLTPATQNVLVGGVGTVVVALRDAAGNVTQPQTVDSVSVVSSGDDTVSQPLLSGNSQLEYGIYDDTITTGSAGTSTITATPLGTLPASGVTAQTATLVKSGTVSNVAAAGISVVTPVKQIAGGAFPNFTTQIPEGTTNVTVRVDDTTVATAGNTIRLKAVVTSTGSLSGATLNGSPVLTTYVDVTTNASKQATANFTLGGAAVLQGATLTVSQVNVSNAAVGVQNAIALTTPTVLASTILISPDDSQVAKIGTVTPVAVTVTDQFGTPQSNWTVQIYRGATVSGGTFLSQGTTDAAGKTSVSVTNVAGIVSGTTEQYSITTFYGSQVATDNSTLWINYTTDGNITGLNVTATSGTAFSNLTTPASLATIPYQYVPFTGTAATTAGAPGTYTVATATGTPSGNLSVFTPTATPANNITVTVGAGAKVSALPTNAWDGGAQSVTVRSGAPVYVWATTTGDHEVVFTSGGLTAIGKIKVATAAAAAYNVAITPKEQTIAKGGFGEAFVTVTDVFGNAVPGGDDTNALTVTATGEVRLGGLNVTQNVTVGANGTAAISLVAGSDGTGSGSVTPKFGVSAPAWQASFVPPTGAPAPKTSDAAVVKVGAVVDRSITITGSRTTVSGKPGIKIEGVVSGIEDGKTVIPYFRFPGETTFAQGSARPEIADGSFTWQRKTGKKFYAYVTNDDGAVKSNRVIIAAN